jgi:cytoskeletal protein CcmA (bactofilin family)
MMKKTDKDGFSQRNTDVSAFLEEGSELEGNLTFSGVVRINGRFVGQITSPDALIVGVPAAIDGTLHVGSANIGGFVKGLIVARERIELQKTARVEGTLNAPAIIVHEGAQIIGELNIVRTPLTAAVPTQGPHPTPKLVS